MNRQPRTNWQMPPMPVEPHDCPHGGHIQAEAYVALGQGPDDPEEGWRLLWSCSECNAEFGDIEWPFDFDEGADEDDLSALGFNITQEWEPGL